jgi:Ca-activated chloride channel family protein
MTFLDPRAGFAGLAVAAIVALYFLKARRPTQLVASTLWWRPLTLDRQAAVPWQRLRPSWLLVLQILAAGLVVGALVQPALASAQALTGQTIVVIDTSETMQATDVAPSRFGQAVADARALVSRLGPHARMTLINMDADPVVLASSEGERQPLLQALGQLRPTDGPADLQDALQLAVAAAGARATGTQLVLLSDGITTALGEPVTLPFPIEYRRIGVGGENAGVTALTVVPGLTGSSAVAHVQNFGQVANRLTVEMAADGHLTDAQAVDLPAGGDDDVTFPVPPGTSYVKVTLLPGDDLAVDDSAVAVASPPRQIRVLLVTAGDVFLEDALELRPDVEVATERPSAWSAGQASSPSVDLLVFDGFVPPRLPARTPYLVVGPPPDAAIGSGPAAAPGPLLPAEANDPLLYDVDLADIATVLSASLTGSHFGAPVITSAAGPVLMVRGPGDGGPAAAVLGIYLHDSDLVLRSAFPVLVTHLSEYLAPDAAPTPSQSAGAAVTLAPGPRAMEVIVTQPDGHTDVVQTVGGTAHGGTVLFTGTSEVGLYRVTVVERGGARQESYLAVNALGTSIRPLQSLEVTGTPGNALPTTSLYRSLWPALAVAALLTLLLEWVVYHRAG